MRWRFSVFFFLPLTHVLPGNLWFWHLHAGASGGAVSCRVVSFFHRTANVLIPDEHGRQECAFNGKAKVLWEELRWDPQDSGRDVRCGHLCRFLIWWSIFFLNFISFFRGHQGKNGDRFHKETVYLTVSQWWIQTFLEFSHLFDGRWTHFDFCIFSAMSWLRWRTSSCDISRCGWPSSEVSLREKVVVPYVLPLLGWILGHDLKIIYLLIILTCIILINCVSIIHYSCIWLLETSFCFRGHQVGFPIRSSTSIIHLDAEDCTRLSIMLPRNHFLGNKSPWLAIVLLAYRLVVVKQKNCWSIVLSPINHQFPPPKKHPRSPRFRLFPLSRRQFTGVHPGTVRWEVWIHHWGGEDADGAEQIQLGENVDENRYLLFLFVRICI